MGRVRGTTTIGSFIINQSSLIENNAKASGTVRYGSMAYESLPEDEELETNIVSLEYEKCPDD